MKLETLPLLSAVRERIKSGDSRKWQCAVFIAQSVNRSSWFSFSLMRGRVFSEELDQELFLLGTAKFSAATEALSAVAEKAQQADEQIASQVVWLLEQDTELVEAAATLTFFNEEGLGDPSKKLRWYNALSPTVRSAATQLDPKKSFA